MDVESDLNHSVYLSIGSNLGDRKTNVRKALEKLSEFCRVADCSKPYRMKPYGVLDQPDFLNLAARIETDLTPPSLLLRLQEVEAAVGRVRTGRWRERIIDLDILFYDDLVMFSPDLIIPHPDLHNRYFVLKPMMDIAPDYVHPVMKMTITEIYSDLMDGKDR